LGYGKQNLRRRQKERFGSEEDLIAIRATLAPPRTKERATSEDHSFARQYPNVLSLIL
jgi:hypothetical protein